ncbi:MAG: peptidase M13 [Kordiimonadaceae bacterium]|jgi:putative endopeptidase|nr:peptidase M13 [Kordiimonadaceae bacterium]
MNKLMGMVAAVALLTNCDNPQSADVNMSEADLKVESGVTLTNMDLTVNPGDDFFEYVNGTWLENTDIPSDKRRYGSFDVLRDNAQTDVRAIIEEASSAGAEFGSNQQKVGDLYKSYMDMDTRNALGIAPLKEGLDAINAISDLNELSAYFAVAGKYSLTTPLALYVGVDAKIPTQYSLHIYQLGLGLPDRDYYFNEDEKSKEIRDKYVVHIEKMLDLAQIENASASAQTVMDIEIKIANLHWKKEDNRDSNKRYNKYEIAELKSLLSNMDLDAYFDETGVQNVEAVVVNQPSYLEGLNGMLADIDLTAWKTYLKWSYVNDMAGRLNSDMDNQNFDFYSRTLSGVEEQRPMWRRAVSTVSGNLGEVVGEVYVSKHFTPDTKARMVELVDNLIKSYELSIKNLDWMGEETKQKALIKLSKFTPKIGYPDVWKDYSKLVIQPDDLVGNITRSALVVHNRELGKLGGPIDKTEWGMTPQTVNAYYNPTMNEIVFPAAILQPPFFFKTADNAINYGGIGGVIGHEIGHGFDDSGSRYNGDGKLENWWTDNDKEKFKLRTDALVAQYDAYEPVEGVNVNGAFTLGENIGDLSGLSIAYKAYKISLNGAEAPVIDGLTGDQRFFIGWAQAFLGKIREEALVEQIRTDPHSPTEYRVNGIVYNVDAFYEAFNVGPEHALYIKPEDRVRIW